MRLTPEEFDQALVCAAANNIARPHIIEREIEKAKKKKNK
jgi:hypothetical protein